MTTKLDGEGRTTKISFFGFPKLQESIIFTAQNLKTIILGTFYISVYYINWVKTSWTYSTLLHIFLLRHQILTRTDIHTCGQNGSWKQLQYLKAFKKTFVKLSSIIVAGFKL